MTRIAILKRDDMNEDQGRIYDAVEAEGGPLGGPFHPKRGGWECQRDVLPARKLLDGTRVPDLCLEHLKLWKKGGQARCGSIRR